MTEFARQFVIRIMSRDTWRAARSQLLWVSLLVLCISAVDSSTKGAPIQNIAAASSGPGPTVAIADFDGDHRLDLASIQTGPTSCGSSAYWIQFQLSTAGRQSIQLVAPPGGLRIEARDVNGDHAVDLVFTSAWFRQPVAILLNDGHGSFARAEPTEFPSVFNDPQTRWLAGKHPAPAAVGLPPQSRVGVDEAAKAPLREPAPAGFTLTSIPAFPAHTILLLSAGRAPPFAVSFR